MPMLSCEPLTSTVPGGFSLAKSRRACFSRSPSGRCVPQSSMAFLRVLLLMPLRSLKACVGSMLMVSTLPPWCLAT